MPSCRWPCWVLVPTAPNWRVGRHWHGILSVIEVTIVFHPYLHLLVFVCDYLPIGVFEVGCPVLGRTQYPLILNVIPLMFPVMAAVCILAELCPILVCTSHHGLLNLALGSSQNLQVPFAAWLFVLNPGGDGSHFGRLGVIKPIVSLRGSFPEGLCVMQVRTYASAMIWETGSCSTCHLSTSLMYRKEQRCCYSLASAASQELPETRL